MLVTWGVTLTKSPRRVVQKHAIFILVFDEKDAATGLISQRRVRKVEHLTAE